jgi:hypothetical protein
LSIETFLDAVSFCGRENPNMNLPESAALQHQRALGSETGFWVAVKMRLIANGLA